MMDNIIMVRSENGVEFEIEVLDIFNVEGYEGKDYILYTRGKEIDDDNIEVYVSKIEQEDDHFNLLTIEDDQEWEAVEKAMDEMGDVDELQR